MTGSAVKILVIIVCGMLAAVVMKSTGSGFSPLLTVALSVAAFSFTVLCIQPITDFVSKLSESAGISGAYLTVILKALGLCLTGDFASAVCRDCGENALAQNSELISKCAIIIVAIPVYSDVYEMILKLWESV